MADPVQTQTYTSNIPQELLPYEQTLLDTASQFTNIANNPYQQYQGERVAQLSPLTQQAMDTASQMGVSGQIGAASDIAGAAGIEALTPYSFNAPGVSQQYMSPYMQNVVDVQQQQAKRQAAIAQQAQQAQAANAGAFGGGRQGIMQAQANAELQRNLQGIQATGLQNAYQQGMQQYNQEQSQRLQGLQTGIQSANTLGTLGQNQFTQQAGILGMQEQLGQAEQQRAQDVLNAQYQDYQNYQNYPYKQLGFMSDIIRGVPTTTSASSIYQAPPTTMQNLTSLGLGAYGLNSLFKAEGGTVKSYANGGTVGYDNGGSVLSPQFKDYAVGHIDPRQLPIAQRNAQARGDLDTAQYAMEQMAQDAALRRGIAGAVPPGTSVVRAAGGGILAFAGDEDENDPSTGQQVSMGVGNASMGRRASGDALDTAQQISELEYQGYTPDEINTIIKNRFATEETLAGPSPYGAFQKYITEAEGAREGNLGQAKGVAALEAAAAALQPGGTMRGLAAAGSTFGKAYGQALQADRAEKRSLANMQFNLADAQRKERMGMTKDAIAAATAAQKDKLDAHKAEISKLSAVGKIQAQVAAANRGAGGAGAGGAGKLPQVDRRAAQLAEQIADLREKNPEDKQIPVLEKKLTALKDIIATTKTSDIGPGKTDIEAAKLAAMTDKDIDAQVKSTKFMDAEWQDAMGDPTKQAAVERRIRNELVTRRNTAKADVNKNSGDSGKIKPIKLD